MKIKLLIAFLLIFSLTRSFAETEIVSAKKEIPFTSKGAVEISSGKSAAPSALARLKPSNVAPRNLAKTTQYAVPKLPPSQGVAQSVNSVPAPAGITSGKSEIPSTRVNKGGVAPKNLSQSPKYVVRKTPRLAPEISSVPALEQGKRDYQPQGASQTNEHGKAGGSLMQRKIDESEYINDKQAEELNDEGFSKSKLEEKIKDGLGKKLDKVSQKAKEASQSDKETETN
jgi:hypothetical protein